MLEEHVLATTWQVSQSIEIGCDAEVVYELVSDITRASEWSSECSGGKWVSGNPAEVGSRFVGYNEDHGMSWTSESEVVKADRPTKFSFSVLRFRVGGPDDNGVFGDSSDLGDMSWSFAILPTEQGCILTQVHAMNSISSFFRQLLESVDDPETYLAERREQLARDMTCALGKIKLVAEGAARSVTA